MDSPFPWWNAGPVLDLNDIRVFAKVAELQSVSGAARALAMPKSSVSRSVARLEVALGAGLLRRSTRRLGLTEAGALFHEHCRRVLGEAAEAEQAVAQLHAVPRGLLRVSAPITLGQAVLGPLLPAFLERYPQVRVSLELTSRRVDILEEGVDVAVRIGALPDSSLLARRLGTSRSSLLASPAYLARHPPPREPADLASHTAVDLQLGGATGRRAWHMIRLGDEAAEVEVEPRLLANDPGVVRLAVLGGAGLGWLPSFLCADDLAAGRLVEVLPGWRRPGPDIHAVFPGQRGGAPSPTVRVFVDFLVAVVATTPPWDPAAPVPPDDGP